MKTLQDHLGQIKQQKVLVRANFDVPIQDGQVVDTTRIENAIDTIKTLRQNQNGVIVLAHYDRPDGQPDPQKSLRPIVPILEQLTGEKVEFIEYSPNIADLVIPQMLPITLIENLRFWPGEEANQPEFSQTISTWGQAYVNEAFANCHREHASIVGLPQLLPSYAGLSLTEEIAILHKVKTNPDQPLVIIIGGAKLETKEPLIDTFADTADKILVGGKSAVDLQGRESLPPNVVIADLVKDTKDITKQSAKEFAAIINSAHTVIWNGTMGVFEEPNHQLGTKIVAQAVNSTPAYTLVGGGDTETALTQLNLESGIDFISSGGGAMLTYLSEGELVGTEALR